MPASVRAALPTPDASWPRRPLIELGAPLVGLPPDRADLGTTGEGATICLVDTGVDLAAAELRDADDRTRVRWLLDLDGAPRGAHSTLEAEFGAAVYDGDELDLLGAAAPGDWHGHGTAMAMVAAGDDAGPGGRTPGPRAGAAPGASLIVVRALRRGVPGFRDEDLMLGARFCSAVAGLGARPTSAARTVLLLGSGGHDGAHDGSSPLEQALSAEVDAGRAVVVAAGNDGGHAVHVGGSLDQGSVETPFFVPAPVGVPGARSVALTVYVGADSGATAALVAPDGTRTPNVGAGREQCVDHPGGRLCVDARSGPEGGARRLHAVVAGGGDVPAELDGGTYRLVLQGRGRFDAWIAGADVGAALGRAEFLGELTDDARSVTLPATAPGVLAVGAALSRADPLPADDARGRPLPSSSRGPNRLGWPKPDLIAPGTMFVPLSADVRPGDGENMFAGLPPERVTTVDGEGRVALSGSSFAAPWVAGALALAYGSGPSDLARDADLLRATARPDGHAYTPAAGAGLLDVAAFLDARGRTLGAADPHGVTYAWTAPGEVLVVRLMDADGRPARGRVALLSGGVELLAREVGAGWAAIAPPAEETLTLSVDGRRVATLAPDVGGCAVVGPPGAEGRALPAWLALCALGLVVGRVRACGAG